IIATNNGGQREYINSGKNGLLVPPNDAKALAEAMGQLIDNPTLRKQLGKQAKEDFEDHMTYEHFYAKMSAIYQP
ncbi:MAG: glycosyltransferase family 4 protein, partial [Prevotella sp.]|nr:glycosyltransferase family 4 protein [Prevotella sp.]